MITIPFSVQPIWPQHQQTGEVTNIVGGFNDGLGRSFAVPVALSGCNVSAKAGPDGKWNWHGEKRQDVNGLRACPSCGTVGEVRLQTPPDDDKIVRRVYFRCFKCHTLSPNFPDWKPCHWHDTGKALWAPLRDFFNQWAAQSAEG